MERTPPPRASLSDLERTLLLALLHCGGTGYGVELQSVIEERTGRRLSPGGLYTALARMQDKGFVRSFLGEPTPERGGRRKRYFEIAPAGETALHGHLDDLRALTAGLPARYRLS